MNTHLLNNLVHSRKNDADELDFKANRAEEILRSLEPNEILDIEVNINYFGRHSESIKFRKQEGKILLPDDSLVDSLGHYLRTYVDYHRTLAEKKRGQIQVTVDEFIVEYLKGVPEEQVASMMHKVNMLKNGVDLGRVDDKFNPHAYHIKGTIGDATVMVKSSNEVFGLGGNKIRALACLDRQIEMLSRDRDFSLGTTYLKIHKHWGDIQLNLSTEKSGTEDWYPKYVPNQVLWCLRFHSTDTEIQITIPRRVEMLDSSVMQALVGVLNLVKEFILNDSKE